MPTVDEYLDAAISAKSLPSDRQLSIAVGLNPGAISEYRQKRAWPDDATMIKIAELGGYSSAQALMDLNIWRSKDSKVQGLYRQIAATLTAACFACILLWPVGANATGTVLTRAAADCIL